MSGRSYVETDEEMARRMQEEEDQLDDEHLGLSVVRDAYGIDPGEILRRQHLVLADGGAHAATPPPPPTTHHHHPHNTGSYSNSNSNSNSNSHSHHTHSHHHSSHRGAGGAGAVGGAGGRGGVAAQPAAGLAGTAGPGGRGRGARGRGHRGTGATASHRGGSHTTGGDPATAAIATAPAGDDAIARRLQEEEMQQGGDTESIPTMPALALGLGGSLTTSGQPPTTATTAVDMDTQLAMALQYEDDRDARRVHTDDDDDDETGSDTDTDTDDGGVDSDDLELLQPQVYMSNHGDGFSAMLQMANFPQLPQMHGGSHSMQMHHQQIHDMMHARALMTLQGGLGETWNYVLGGRGRGGHGYQYHNHHHGGGHRFPGEDATYEELLALDEDNVKVGLSSAAISALPTHTFTTPTTTSQNSATTPQRKETASATTASASSEQPSSGSNKCAVCLCEWLKSKKTCPVCLHPAS
ncbi:hypothetical protein Pelo_13617 [Pelomyxa schiedti]|nr:hypothetical protein Pelo_13617 [Pelomyxa schiedti]